MIAWWAHWACLRMVNFELRMVLSEGHHTSVTVPSVEQIERAGLKAVYDPKMCF